MKKLAQLVLTVFHYAVVTSVVCRVAHDPLLRLARDAAQGKCVAPNTQVVIDALRQGNVRGTVKQQHGHLPNGEMKQKRFLRGS